MDAGNATTACTASDSDDWTGLQIFLLALVFFFVVLFPAGISLFVWRRAARLRVREAKALKRRQDHVQRMCDDASVLEFPMCAA